MASAVPSPTPEGGQAEDVKGPEVGGAAGGADAPGGSAPGEVAPPEPKKQRVRREKLPGVVSGQDGEDIFPDLGYRGRDGKRVSKLESARELNEEIQEEWGTKNFFGLPEPPPEVKAPEAKKPEEAPKKFTFAGKEYDSPEAAEQSFKSLQGMFKPLQERATKAEEMAEKAAESARAWRQRAMDLESGAYKPQQQQQQQVQPQQSQQSAQMELEKALGRVDGELFERLAREQGLPIAGRYLAAQVLATVHDDLLPALRKEIMDQIAPELEPLKQDRGFQQATQHVASLMDQVGEYKNQDGSIAFPELHDEQTVYEIGDLWRSLNLPAEIALTQQGLLQAIALYRMYRGTTPQTASTQPQVAVSAPPNMAPAASAASLEAGVSQSPVAGRAGAESESTRFARNLDGADLIDRTLGFAVRRRR